MSMILQGLAPPENYKTTLADTIRPNCNNMQAFNPNRSERYNI